MTSLDKYVEGIIQTRKPSYIPYISCYRNLNLYNPNCKTQRIISYPTHISKYMLLVHIHPYMSKPSLLLKTDDETWVMLWIPYIPGTTAQDVPELTQNLPLDKKEGGSYIMPIQKCNKR